MSDVISVVPAKVQLIEADGTYSEVNGIIEGAEVELDPNARTVRISSPEHEEKGSIEGDLIASARGLKVTCGVDDGVRKSLHLAFSERSELDELLGRLEQGGLPAVRSLDEDPELRTADETAGEPDR
jgi:hypothetical protein